MTISKIKLPGASAAQDIKDSGAQRRYTGTVQWVGDVDGANLPYPSPSDAAYGDFCIASDGIVASGRDNISTGFDYGLSLRISRNGTSTSFNKTSTITVKIHKFGDGPDTYRKYRIYIQNNYLNVYKIVNNGGGEGNEERVGYKYITTLPFYIEVVDSGVEFTWTETDTENPDLDDYITFDLVYKSAGVYQHNGTSWGVAPDLSKKADKATMPGGILPSDMIAELDDYGNLKYNGHRISQFSQVEANPTVPSGTTPTTLENLKVGNDYYSVPQSGSGTPSQHYYNCPLADVTSPQEGDVCVVPETEEEVTADSNGNFAINGVGVKIEENANNPIPSDGSEHNIYIGKTGVGYDDTVITVLGKGSDGISTDLPYTFVDYGGIAAVGTNPSGMGQHQSAYYTVKNVVPSQTYVYVNGAWRSDNNDKRQKTYEIEFLNSTNADGRAPYWIKSPVAPTNGDIGYWDEFAPLSNPNSQMPNWYKWMYWCMAGTTRAIKVTQTQAIPSAGTYTTVVITSSYATQAGTGYTITAEPGFWSKEIKIVYSYGGVTDTPVPSGIGAGHSVYLHYMEMFDYMYSSYIGEIDPSGEATSLLDYITIEFVNEAGAMQFDGTKWSALPESAGNKITGALNSSRIYTDDQYPSVPTMQAELAKKAGAPNIIVDSSSTTKYLSSSYYDGSTSSFTNGIEMRLTQEMTSINASDITASNLYLSASSEYTAWLMFTSGSTATSFTYPSEWKWSGDDVDNGSFVPAVNKTYNICVWWDGVNLNAIARGTAYVASS